MILRRQKSKGLPISERDRRELRTLVRGLARGDLALADDIEQETLAAALQVNSDHVESMPAWLGSVARNTFRLHLRKKQAGPRFGLLEDHVASTVETDPAELCSMVELRKILAKHLAKLSPEYRSVIQLRIMDGHPPREVAVLLDLPASAVRRRLRRGIDLLRDEVAKELHAEDTAPSRPLLSLVGLLRISLVPAAAALGLFVAQSWASSDGEGALQPSSVMLAGADALSASASVDSSSSTSRVALAANPPITGKPSRDGAATPVQSVEVTVADASGEPLEGATVFVQTGLWGLGRAVGQTDGSGKLLVKDAAPNTWIAATAPGSRYSESVPARSSKQQGGVDLALQERRTDWVYLDLDASLAPDQLSVRSLPLRAEQRTTLDRVRGIIGVPDWIPAKHDGAGRFQLLSRGRRVIEVLGGSGEVLALGSILDPKAEGAEVSMRVGERSTVTGRLVDRRGSPISDVELTLLPEEFRGRAYFSSTTDAQGRFRFENVPAFKWAIHSTLRSLKAFELDDRGGLLELGDVGAQRCRLPLGLADPNRSATAAFVERRIDVSWPQRELLGETPLRETLTISAGEEALITRPGRISVPAILFSAPAPSLGARPLMQLLVRPPGGWSRSAAQVDLGRAEAATLRGRFDTALPPIKAVLYHSETRWTIPLEVSPTSGEIAEVLVPAGEWRVAMLDADGVFHRLEKVVHVTAGGSFDLGRLAPDVGIARIELPPLWLAMPEPPPLRIVSIDSVHAVHETFSIESLEQPWIRLDLAAGQHRLRLNLGEDSAIAELDVVSGQTNVAQARDMMRLVVTTGRKKWKGGDSLTVRVLDAAGQRIDEEILPVRKGLSILYFESHVPAVPEGFLEVVDPSLPRAVRSPIASGQMLQRIRLDRPETAEVDGVR